MCKWICDGVDAFFNNYNPKMRGSTVQGKGRKNLHNKDLDPYLKTKITGETKLPPLNNDTISGFQVRRIFARDYSFRRTKP